MDGLSFISKLRLLVFALVLVGCATEITPAAPPDWVKQLPGRILILDGDDLYSVALNGSGQLKIGKSADSFDVRLSKDSSDVVFVTHDLGGPYRIVIANMATSESRTITEIEVEGAHQPSTVITNLAYAPDKTKIAYVDNAQHLHIVDLATANDQVVYRPPSQSVTYDVVEVPGSPGAIPPPVLPGEGKVKGQRTLQLTCRVWLLEWSTDSQKLFYVTGDFFSAPRTLSTGLLDSDERAVNCEPESRYAVVPGGVPVKVGPYQIPSDFLDPETKAASLPEFADFHLPSDRTIWNVRLSPNQQRVAYWHADGSVHLRDKAGNDLRIWVKPKSEGIKWLGNDLLVIDAKRAFWLVAVTSGEKPFLLYQCEPPKPPHEGCWMYPWSSGQ